MPQAEHSHLIGCYGNGLGDRRVVNGLKVAADLVALGADGQQTGVVLDVPHLPNQVNSVSIAVHR